MESETQATASPPAVAAVASEAQAQDVSREIAGEASGAAAAAVSAGAAAAAKSESDRVEMDTIGDTAPPQAECSTPAAAAAAAQALPHVTAQTPAAEVAPPVRKGDGWAPIKAEFVRSKVEIQASAEASKPKDAAGAPAEGKGGAPAENQSKKGKRGRNKQRPKDQRPSQGDVLCSHISDGRACTFGQSCRFTHDIKAYLEKKGPDIGNMCPVWDARGTCPSGLKCRFGRAHTDPETLRPIAKPGAADPSTFEHMNALSRDLNFKLRRNQVQFACDRRGWKGFLASLEAEYTRPEPGASPAGEPGGIAAAAAAAAVAPAAAADAVPAPAAAVVPTVDDTSGKSGGAMSVDGNGEGDGAGEDSRLGPPSSGPPPAKRVRMEGAENGDQTATDGGGGGGGNEPAGASVSEAAAAATAASGEATSATGAAGAENGAGAEAGGGDVGATGGAEGQGEEEWMRACLEATEPRSRRTIDFEGKVYVAPLTTVGNLPFRRVMKAQGADITCGEMALAHHLLKGNGSEWALLRRHPSEDVFGVQVAGAHPDQMTRVAELLEEHIKVDFVDINMGCPIDLVCDKGMGAALMNRSRKLRGIIAGMTSQLSCPLTVKMRVGWDEKKPNADSVVRTAQREAERSRQRGFPGSVACVMIHGRSRLQRYSKLADWDYVRRVAASQDPSLPPLPVIGNGDILSWRDHEERLEQAKEIEQKEGKSYNWSTCCMLARGALIKPWLPTEVKEKRDWDISSSERLDIYRQFVNFGLEHWGSDQMGVNKTRRFLLEWLSFTCRYIPVGILEVLPQRINERPPPYNGRDELEGLMCSLNPADWIKICEMLLGPAPADFEFEPKHKASAYAPLASTTYI